MRLGLDLREKLPKYYKFNIVIHISHFYCKVIIFAVTVRLRIRDTELKHLMTMEEENEALKVIRVLKAKRDGMFKIGLMEYQNIKLPLLLSICSRANNWKTLEHIVIFRAEIKHSNVNARCLIRCISYMNKLMRDIFPIGIPRIVLSSN